MYALVLRLVHLVGFATFLGGAFAQQQLISSSARTDVAPAARDERERLAAVACTKVEVPGLFVQVASGILVLVDQPDFLKQHWLHGKLTAVVVLLVLSHLEMFNARAIVKLRAAGGASAEAEIAGRKRRHGAMGVVGTVLVVAILLFVTVLRPVM